MSTWSDRLPVPGRRLLVALVVVCLAAVGGAVFAQHQLSQDRHAEDARSAALKAATDRVPTLLTYSHLTLERDLKRALEQTTGSFRDEYELLLEDVIEPGAAKGKVDTSAQVSDAAVVTADESEVEVLLFLSQSTTRGAATVPEVGGSRLRVQMKLVKEKWLIAELQPI